MTGTSAAAPAAVVGGGGWAADAVAIGVVIAIVNAIIACILACSRFFYGTARDTAKQMLKAAPPLYELARRFGAGPSSLHALVRAQAALTPDALAVVAGYCVVNDVRVPHESHYRPSVRQRARDGFCPLGPVIGPHMQQIGQRLLDMVEKGL